MRRFLLLSALLVLSCGRNQPNELLMNQSIVISGGSYKIISGDSLGGKCEQVVKPFYNGSDLRRMIVNFLGSCSKFGTLRLICSGNGCSFKSGAVNVKLSLIDNTHYRFMDLKENTVSKLRFVGPSASNCSGLKGGAWVPVPPNSEVGQKKSFCVMKYEVKNVGDTAVSQPTLKPWINISQIDARKKCQAIGVGYDLMTNAQWQTIARNIELTKDRNGNYLNWSNGSRTGANSINQGNSNSASPAPSSGLERAPWSKYRRTHFLSNGKVIWDISGNVWEWVLEPNTISHGGSTFVSVSQNNSPLKFSPKGDYSKKNSGTFGGLGMAWVSYSKAVIRGGANYNRERAGVFASWLGDAEDETRTYSGFRCVYNR